MGHELTNLRLDAPRSSPGTRAAHPLRALRGGGPRVRALGAGGHLPPGRRRAPRTRTSRSRSHRPTSRATCTWATPSTPRSRTRRSAWRACGASAPSGSTARTTRASRRSAWWSSSSKSEGISRHEIGREAFVERVWEWVEEYGGNITRQFRELGASLDYQDERFTMDPEYVRAVTQGVRAPLREGAHLPRQLHGQLGPGPAHGDLGPRGRAADRRGHALHGRLPARVGLGLGDGRHGAPGDDARGHRDRGEPGRRALLAADRRGRDPAARRPSAADHRRRVRGSRVRNRRAQDHAGARPERLRDRSQARPRRDRRDRRGRPHDGRSAGALPRDGGGRGARRGGRRPARRGADLGLAAVRPRRAALAPLGAARRAARSRSSGSATWTGWRGPRSTWSGTGRSASTRRNPGPACI